MELVVQWSEVHLLKCYLPFFFLDQQFVTMWCEFTTFQNEIKSRLLLAKVELKRAIWYVTGELE